MKYLTLVIIFLLTSCKQEKKVEVNNEKTSFNYRAYLLKNQDSVHFIPIDLNQSHDSIFNTINRFKNQKCTDYLSFNTKIENDTIAVDAYQNCTIYCGIYFNYQILINEEERILFEDRTVDSNNLKSQMLTSLINDEDRYSKKIRFSIYNFSNNQLLTKIIYFQVANAYLDYISKISKAKFSKDLKDLKKHELKYLKDNNQLVLSFKKDIPPPELQS